MNNARENIIFGLILGVVLNIPLAALAVPAEPLGVRGYRNPAGTTLTLLWEAVPQAIGYNIYRRSSPRGTAQKINAFQSNLPVYADYTNGETFYYSVRAVDRNGQESADSYLVDSSAKLNLIFLADDDQTTMVSPGALGDFLRCTHNKYGTALTIKFQEEENPADQGLVRNIRFKLVRSDTGDEVTDLSLPLPEAEIQVGYNVAGGQISASALATISATPEQLCPYWFNGVNWVKLGGTNNPQNQTVTVKSSQLGNYQLRVSPKANTLTLGKANVFPGLFTPNGDGFNDRVYFVLQNPNNAGVTGEIFDVSGRSVVTLAAPAITPGLGTTLIWSGLDANGAVVPSGLYMYRIEGDGQTLTGTVSVAR
jgi:hypothetical protein